MGKENPWATEADKRERKSYEDVRQMRFGDNATHNVRVIVHKDKDKFPFYGYRQHWIPQQDSVKGRPITHSIEEKCVVCEWVSELWTEVNRLKEEADMTEKSPEVIALIAKISEVSGGAPRYDMNIFDRDDMEHRIDKNKKDSPKIVAPKRMSAPSKIWKTIFDYAKNPKWGNPSDEESGYDFEIKTDGEGKRRAYTVVPDRNASPLTEDEIAAVQHGYDLEALRQTSSTKDIVEILTNAKKPFDDILKLVDPKEVENFDIKNKTSEEKVNVEELEKKEKKVEKSIKKEVEEKSNITPEPEPEIECASEEGNPSNINEYECKGQFAEDDKACNADDDPCPVRDECIKFQPIFNKAVKFDIPVKPYQKRPVSVIVEEVEKAEKEAAEKEAKEVAKKKAKEKADKETGKEAKKEEKKDEPVKEDVPKAEDTGKRRRRNVPF